MRKTLKTVDAFTRATNHHLPKANLSNAGYLQGDPLMTGGPDPMSAWKMLAGDSDFDGDADFDGDIDEGDADYVYGDADGYGDADFDGDAEIDFTGAPSRRRRRRSRGSLRLRNSNNVKRTGWLARRLGKIRPRDKWFFFYCTGGVINQSPIPEATGFPALQMRTMLDRQNSDTPFLLDQVGGTVASPTSLTASLAGPATGRLAPIIWIKIGTNALSGIPNSLIYVSASIPLFGGVPPLVISAVPIAIAYNAPFNLTLGIVPWTLVSAIPTATLASYNNAVGGSIDVTVNGLPAANSSLVVMAPGTQHRWTQSMRDAFTR